MNRLIGSRTRRLLASLSLGLGAVLPVVLPQAACAAETSAALVIDNGIETTTYCVDLEGKASVTGMQLIKLAHAQYDLDYGLGYSGLAVCRLNDVGAVSSDCLADQKPNFWGYWRGDGDGGWAWSSSGAASTSVEPGDVDGWSWGTGTDGATHPQLPTTTYAQVCKSPGGGSGGSGGTGGSGGSGGGGGTGGTGSDTGGGTTDDGTTGGSTSGDDTSSGSSSDQGSTGSGAESSGGSSSRASHTSSGSGAQPSHNGSGTNGSSAGSNNAGSHPGGATKDHHATAPYDPTRDTSGPTMIVSAAGDTAPVVPVTAVSGEAAAAAETEESSSSLGMLLALVVIGGLAAAGILVRRKRATG